MYFIRKMSLGSLTQTHIGKVFILYLGYGHCFVQEHSLYLRLIVWVSAEIAAIDVDIVGLIGQRVTFDL